jgi:hypothetical protein
VSVPGRRVPTAVLHLTGAVVVPLCLAAGLLEFGRARAGHQLAWAYTVEWPLIAGYGVYVWARLARERAGRSATVAPVPAEAGEPANAADTARSGDTPAAGPGEVEGDAELAAWRAYLAELHAADPPGGPPARDHGTAGR